MFRLSFYHIADVFLASFFCFLTSTFIASFAFSEENANHDQELPSDKKQNIRLIGRNIIAAKNAMANHPDSEHYKILIELRALVDGLINDGIGKQTTGVSDSKEQQISESKWNSKTKSIISAIKESEDNERKSIGNIGSRSLNKKMERDRIESLKHFVEKLNVVMTKNLIERQDGLKDLRKDISLDATTINEIYNTTPTLKAMPGPFHVNPIILK